MSSGQETVTTAGTREPNMLLIPRIAGPAALAGLDDIIGESCGRTTRSIPDREEYAKPLVDTCGFLLSQVTRSEIFLVSPETKKVSMEKSFREISSCSQV